MYNQLEGSKQKFLLPVYRPHCIAVLSSVLLTMLITYNSLKEYVLLVGKCTCVFIIGLPSKRKWLAPKHEIYVAYREMVPSGWNHRHLICCCKLLHWLNHCRTCKCKKSCNLVNSNSLPELQWSSYIRSTTSLYAAITKQPTNSLSFHGNHLEDVRLDLQARIPED